MEPLFVAVTPIPNPRSPIPNPHLWIVARTYLKLEPAGDTPGAGEYFVIRRSVYLPPSTKNNRPWTAQWWVVVGPVTEGVYLYLRPNPEPDLQTLVRTTWIRPGEAPSFPKAEWVPTS